MQEIYPPAYAHYWKDNGSWYLHKLYNIENLKVELNQKGGSYDFICFRESFNAPFQTIGTLKTISNFKYKPLAEKKAFKIHRIYLHQAMQGKGLGKLLMNYCEELATAHQSNLIWLDAMETQVQAQEFYTSLGYLRSSAQLLDFKLLHDHHRCMWYMHKML